jgi:hypothetical protein
VDHAVAIGTDQREVALPGRSAVAKGGNGFHVVTLDEGLATVTVSISKFEVANFADQRAPVCLERGSLLGFDNVVAPLSPMMLNREQAHRRELIDPKIAEYRAASSRPPGMACWWNSPASWTRAMRAIESCRTAALGGHVERCGDCGHQRVAYNSCRNRNCPKCQGLARAQWLEDRQAELLDVPYFHVVFTVPQEIEVIAFQNQTVVYDILFRAASETLRTVAADPKQLGAEIGFLAVLHTWGQNLMHHPHVHCLVPGGGIAPNGERWIACRPGFFLPVRVLSRMFRGLFLHYLEKALAAGELRFFSAYQPLHEPAAFRRYLTPIYRTEW